MWSGITFDGTQIISQAQSLINTFMPLVYIIGGVAVFGLVILVIIAVAKRSVG
jgi:hypothetical protein